MTKRHLPIAVVVALLLVAFQQALRAKVRPAPASAAEIITIESSQSYVDVIASDAMQGRQTPSRELDSAAQYIANEFARAGLEPLHGSYFNEFDLKRDDLGAKNELSIDHRVFTLKDDFIPYEFTGEDSISANIVFAGYGVSLPDSGYDDYEGIDVSGKIVVVVAGEPQRFLANGYSLRTSWFATSKKKMLTAANHGAVALWIIPNPRYSRLMRPTGYPWPAFYPIAQREPLRLRLHEIDTARIIPAISIGGNVTMALFGSRSDAVMELMDRIDSTSRPHSRTVAGTARLTTSLRRTLVPARNVVGILRGREYPDEFVVLGAHYDHVGTRRQTLAGEGRFEDTVFNGADDNASGVAALLINARAYGSLRRDERPMRSMMFVAFTAEELGLYGSRAFVATSRVDPDRMVAMLNMDMVGRNNIDSISVGGMGRSPELAYALGEANRSSTRFVITDDVEKDFYRSDQASFARAGVPVLFFHSGDHADYHREGDNPDRINSAKLARVARLIFGTSWIVAESPARPTFTGVDLNDSKASFIFDR